jgi:hypothetical protein
MSNQVSLFDSSETVEEVIVNFTPEELAYFLAYSNSEFGTKLLEELLYYKQLGRI